MKGALWNAKRSKTTKQQQQLGWRKSLIWSIQIGKEPYKNYTEKNRVLQNAKENNKTTKKKSSDRRRPN